MPSLDHYTLSTLLRTKFREKPESKCVNDVIYDPETQEMTVIFQQRGTYVYKDVPLDVYVDFHSSGSQGTYFNSYIRDTYTYQRIS